MGWIMAGNAADARIIGPVSVQLSKFFIPLIKAEGIITRFLKIFMAG